MTEEQIVDGITRHFLTGCEGLSAVQLDQHKEHGSCPECEETAAPLPPPKPGAATPSTRLTPTLQGRE